MGCLYKLTSPSGKSYIGISSKTTEARWGKHVEHALGKRENGALYRRKSSGSLGWSKAHVGAQKAHSKVTNWVPAYEADHYVEWLEYIAKEFALYEAEVEASSCAGTDQTRSRVREE